MLLFSCSIMSTLCNPMDCSMPGFPVLHDLLKFAQICGYWVSNAIWPSNPLSHPSPPVLNLSQHQGLFQRISYMYTYIPSLLSLPPTPTSHPSRSSRSFIVLYFMCRLMVHFELSFVKGVNFVSRFIFSYVCVQFFWYCLWRRLSLLCYVTFAALSNRSWLSLGSLVYFHWSICLLFCHCHAV